MEGRSRVKLLLCWILVCCFTLSFNSSSLQAQERMDSNIVYYQTDISYPPFEFVKDGQSCGFDLDIGRLIFSNSPYRVYYTYDVWEKVYQRLKNGEIDICGLLAITEERKKEILYTKPVLKTYISVYGKKDTPIDSLASLKGHKIGVQKGDYGQKFLHEKLGLREYYAFNNLEEGITALEKGKIDVIFGNQEVINYFLVKNQLNTEIIPHLTNLFPTFLAYGVNKERPDLVIYMNKQLDELRKAGIYEGIFQKYFYRHSYYYNADLNRRNFFLLAIALGILLVGLIVIHLVIRKLDRMVKAATAKLEEEREWFRVTLSSIGDGVIATDVEGRITFINWIAEEMTGFNQQEALGRPVEQIFRVFNEETGQPAEIPVAKVLKEKRVIELANHTFLVSQRGQKHSIADSAAPICNDQGEIIGVIMVFQDMTEERLIAQALEQNEIKYRNLFERANDAIILAQGPIIIDCNSKALSMLKAKREEVVGYPVYKFSPESQPDGTFSVEGMRRMLEDTREGKSRIFEWRCLGLDGSAFDVEASVSKVQLNDQELHQAILRDISEKKRSEGIIHYQAYYDVLTNLPNRVLFYEKLTEALKQARKNKEQLAVYFIDLDSFKNVNDTLGHHVGDLLLEQVAQRLAEALGDEVIIARMGGDEFAILLTNVQDKSQSINLANRVLQTFTTLISVEGYDLFISGSIGVTLYPEHGDSVDVLMKNADAAMYKAKQMGRNNYQYYSLDMQEKALKKLNLEKQLREAVEKKEFINYYQPKVDLETGRILSWEALVRWQSSERGLIFPGEFIPVAEEIGLISSIEELVLSAACSQIKEWIEEKGELVSIAINLSACQFRQSDLIERVSKIINRMEVNPCCLELEITESIAIDDINYTVNMLNKLREMGIRIAIDDFGTGYSSLSYLRSLPVDDLKIDRSFIQDIVMDRDTYAIVKAIIEVAHSLGLKVVAEGVETKEQLEALRALRCDRVQGYLLAKPLPPHELSKLEWFKRNRFSLNNNIYT